MHTKSEHEAFINVLLADIWQGGTTEAVLRDNVAHGIGETLPDLLRPIQKVVASLHQPPTIKVSGEKAAHLKLPGPGNNKHSFYLNLPHDVSATAYFRIEAALSDTTWDETTSVEVDVDVPWYAAAVGGLVGGAVAGPFGVAAGIAFTATALKEAIDAGVEAQIAGNDMAAQLGALSTLRYDRTPEFRLEGGMVEQIDTFLGSPPEPLGPSDWLDIVFIADGFTTAEMGDFRAITNMIVNTCREPSRLDNEHLRRVFWTMRFWRVPAEDAGLPNSASVSSALSKGKRVSTLGNLARLAEAGLCAQEAIKARPESRGAGRPIYIVIPKKTNTARAIALGRLIILPAGTSNSAQEEAASVFIHELGHTIGLLGDEYQGKNAKPYMGPEPAQPNLTILPHRWPEYIGANKHGPDYEVSLSGFPGAYEFSDVKRPAKACKMRQDREDRPFCPVCERGMTEGLLRELGLGNSSLAAPLIISVTYLSPWRSKPQLYSLPAPVWGAAGDVVPLQVYRPGPHDADRPTQVRVKLIAGAVPDGYGSLIVGTNTPESSEVVEVGPDTMAIFRVRCGDGAPVSEGVRDVVEQRAVIVFRQAPEVGLLPPRHLKQEPAVGASAKVTISPKGRLKTGITLFATSSAGINHQNKTETVFEIVSARGNVVWEGAQRDAASTITDHDVEVPGLPPGRYTWRAYTRIWDTSLSSQVEQLPADDSNAHFTIETQALPQTGQLRVPFALSSAVDIEGPALPMGSILPRVLPGELGLPVPGPRDLNLPHDLSLPRDFYLPRERRERDSPRPGPTVTTALRASAFHPLRKPIVFEFQADDDGSGFKAVGTVTQPAPRSLESLVVTASVVLDQGILAANWRVRVTEVGGGHASVWATPASSARTPIRLADF